MNTRTAETKTLWYKDAIIYEVHVRSFYDSNGDGIGDFKGLSQKLDYLKFLGINTIWLLPFYPSPLKDEGYDIAHYTKINPDYGTLADFKQLLKSAHQRDIRVITELVINHTSDQHPWFQKSRQAKPGTYWRRFYVWSDTTDRYQDARIIFKDFEVSNWTWDPVAGAYYWHRFYAHQPDLNYDNPNVQRSVLKILDFWLSMGVDGLRLDAIPYLFQREGTNCENLAETHDFIITIRGHVETHYPDRLLLAEANQWPEEAAAYFGDNDECHMAYHFPVMPRMYMGIHMEDRFPMTAIMEQTPAIPADCQWALFLRNHDELTLEMVTDEERDYMYRMFARDPKMRLNLGIRRRLAPLLSNDRRKIELMHGLLFSLPGTPVIYYGDEIGMGDNFYLGDRNGVRTPMQWRDDRNAGFSEATPQKLYLPVIIDPEYHYAAVNVAIQKNNPRSLLWWMKRMMAMRKRFKAFGRGRIEFLHPENRKILAFIRTYKTESILVVANLSAHPQYAELDLSAYQGLLPVELFGQTQFPRIGQPPYLLTLGPYGFYWFSLQTQMDEALMMATFQAKAQTLALNGPWQSLLQIDQSGPFEAHLLNYMANCRWFGGKSQAVSHLSVEDIVSLDPLNQQYYLLIIQVDYFEQESARYLLPITLATGTFAQTLQQSKPEAIICAVKQSNGEQAVLIDAVHEPLFNQYLLKLMHSRKQLKGHYGHIKRHTSRAYKQLLNQSHQQLDAHVNDREQSNTTLFYDHLAILKLFRRVESGINPEVEMGHFLEKHSPKRLAPRVLADLSYQWGDGQCATLAVVQEYISNEGEAWQYTLDALHRYFENALTQGPATQAKGINAPRGFLDPNAQPNDAACDMLNHYRYAAAKLGERTADLHLALASDTHSQAFKPEAFTGFDRRNIYQKLRHHIRQNTDSLSKQVEHLGDETQTLVQSVIDHEPRLLAYIETLLTRNMDGVKIRTHGDFHLGQVLYVGNDFLIIDFEGEPARALSERHIKRSPLRDVAGMMRSFHYAVNINLAHHAAINPERRQELDEWARLWYRWVINIYFNAYENRLGGRLLPSRPEDRYYLLSAYMLEKAIYEIGYEANNRPEWLWIPCRGVDTLLDDLDQHQ